MSPRAAWRLESLGFSRVYDYVAGEADWLAFGLPTEGTNAGAPRAGQIARRNVSTCQLSDRVGAVYACVQAANAEFCIVINETGIVLGRVQATSLTGDEDGPIADVMEAGPTTVRPSEPLEDLTARMRDRNVDTILVTTSDGKLVGILHRHDAEHYLAERAEER